MSKQTRRGFLAAVAGVTAAVGLAGGVKAAEAAPSDQMPTLPPGEAWVLSSEVRDARAEGYRRGYAVADSRAESRAMRGLRA